MTPTPSSLPCTRQLTEADLPQVIELQTTVTAELPNGYVFPKTDSEVRSYLTGTLGVAYGVFEGARLVASSLLRLPSPPHPNDASMPFPIVPEDEWTLGAAGLGNTLVLPAARGRGYQRTLIDARISHAKSARMRWTFAGVHLGNSTSWSNLIAKGMAIVGIRADFGYPVIGLLRRVSGQRLAIDEADRILVDAHDTSQHEEALNDGYVGVGITSVRSVVYCRLSAPDDSRAMAVLYQQSRDGRATAPIVRR
jgi:GNAT superfamily N-acetyltransferase